MQGSDGSGVVPGFPSGPRWDGLFAAPGRGITARWAWGVFAVLFLVHLLESLDRWLLPAVLRPVSEELELTDAQAGWLATVLLISYALWGPFVANVVLPNMRAVAYAVAMAATHLLGDLWSPTLMGWVWAGEKLVLTELEGRFRDTCFCRARWNDVASERSLSPPCEGGVRGGDAGTLEIENGSSRLARGIRKD